MTPPRLEDIPPGGMGGGGGGGEGDGMGGGGGGEGDGMGGGGGGRGGWDGGGLHNGRHFGKLKKATFYSSTYMYFAGL